MSSQDSVIINTSEICLKGANRPYFEQMLAKNVRECVAGLGAFRVVRMQGSIALYHDGPMSDSLAAAVKEALPTVFGIGHFFFAARCDRDMETIKATAASLLAQEMTETFKVETTRSDKRYPLKSPEMSALVGEYLLDAVPGRRVDVHDPQTTVDVRIDAEHAFVSAGRIECHGGLPTGVSGNVAVLLSGGIDSPVAAWKVMRRGTRAVFVHFHSYPYVGAASIDKVKRLVAILDRYQRRSTLYLVPLADAQREIAAKADPSMRIVLYRRMMLRIAERIAAGEGCRATVTGDSIGQVASQTLENLATVSVVARMPIFRPLIGDDKNDIIAVARRIGTYATSIERQDDCCSMFMPPQPVIRSTIERAEKEEAKYDVERLAREAIAAAEKTSVTVANEPATIGLKCPPTPLDL